MTGERIAEYELALLYGTGRGVARDDARALTWLRKSAEADVPRAQYLLAAIYWRGRYGVEMDPAKAATWLKRAAEQGYPDAEYALGLAYHQGRGVPKNPSSAYIWIERAARHGQPQAVAAMKRARALQPKGAASAGPLLPLPGAKAPH